MMRVYEFEVGDRVRLARRGRNVGTVIQANNHHTALLTEWPNGSKVWFSDHEIIRVNPEKEER
jgi:hypothetical protein